MPTYDSAVFGNRGGSHQLLTSSLPATAPVLDALRFLVDRPAGHVGPEVTWSPYWGCQPIERWWVVWRGEEDVGAPRKNMVIARVALLPVEHCATLDDLKELFESVGYASSASGDADVSLAGSVVDCLARGEGPAIVADLTQAPLLLREIWPRLWASARASLSLRTLFGVESLDSVLPSSIVVIPTELKPRWLGRKLVGHIDTRNRPAGRWFAGNASPHLARMINANKELLPGDLTVLDRVERIVERLERIHSGHGSVTDALLIVRTQEAFTGGFVLAPDDLRVLGNVLSAIDAATVNEIRTASLAKLDAFRELDPVEASLSRWVEKQLPQQSVVDALWILEHHLGEAHAAWWRRAVGLGVDAGCRAKSRQWATAIWRWWEASPDSVRLLTCHLDDEFTAEEWLAASAPPNVDDAVVDALEVVCRDRKWPTLFARILGSNRTLLACVEKLRANFGQPEAGLESLLRDRSAAEIVDSAVGTCWSPLVNQAVRCSVANPQLFARAPASKGLVHVLSRHLLQGGELPAVLVREDFLLFVFAAAVKQDEDALVVVKHLDRRAGRFILDFPDCEALLVRVGPDVAQGAAEEWWQRFLTDASIGRPPRFLCSEVLKHTRSCAGGKPIALMLSLLGLFPEITEADFEEWMNHTGFLWQPGDHQRIAAILVERRWWAAAKTLRWSWKSELQLVAWYAQDLLSWYDRFWSAPNGVNQLARSETIAQGGKQMKVLFLAANPLSSSRLALDEEARAIEEKVRDAKYRDLIAIRTRWAVRPEDLQQALLEDEPTVVHFSGHGGGIVGIVLHSADQINETLVASEALTDLFRVLKDNIRVIVLNSCYSEVQARSIVEEIDFVVGMSDSIEDDAARVFAAAFYRGLAFGRTVQTAFDLGINELKLLGLEHSEAIPQLLVRPGRNANVALVSKSSA